ncbi:hypothetical protein HSBAA_30630 [Vreelandella sulfidaeris]|uniref:Uncharacterized protein n=1 Tax=Vreelandella sulfidaeris TaxID=115553 RepID=A0A455U896_9GAMM|nr:hypothetical protein HSBAA_30630 [Halomonas sulfidaeris]
MIYLTEYDAERIYSGRMGDGRNLEDFLTYISRVQQDKYRKSGFIWPQAISRDLSDSLHPMNVNFNNHSPSIIAESILTELKLPFLVDGCVVNVNTSQEDVSIPELDDSIAAEVAEFRNINPNYGVLKF